MSWDILLTTEKDVNAIKDVFIFVEDDSDIKINIIDDEGYLDSEEEYKKIGEILVDRGELTEKELKEILSQQKKFGEIATESELVDEVTVEAAVLEQKFVRQMREQKKKLSQTTTIRVNNDRLDEYVNLVGELVTLQSSLTQYALNHQMPDLTLMVEQLERLTTELRDNAMIIRMVQIGESFGSFQRLVRDLSHELGKEVEMVTYGAETELDKNVIEALKDPILHILRNSIDHGIEFPDKRESKGKPRIGTVSLRAMHSGAYVLIKVQDDGAGLNLEKIEAKALERNLISASDELDPKEIMALIFHPGFSTSERATSVSGRGVGMDVVKSNVEKLRGSIEVDSQEGVGTTITLKIPLTLAIIDGLMLSVNNDYFVVNLSIVDECVDLSEDIRGKDSGKAIANIRGELIPYINLRKYFDLKGEPPEIEQMVIVNIDDGKLGLVVDFVMGQHQTVIKSLGRILSEFNEISGATILGDGSIALILDVAKIADSFRQEKKKKKENWR